MSDSFIINNLTKLAMSIRKNAALSFSEDYTENLDNFISIGQMEILILNHAIKNDDGSLILDEQGYEDIFDETRIWIYNIGLAKLAAEDKVECAWDDESNEMIFWTKDSKTKRKSNKNHKKKK